MNKAYTPPVNIAQIRAYRPEAPETYTVSNIVNAVAEAIMITKSRNSDTIADYLSLDKRKLSHAIEIETGYSLKDLLIAYHLDEISAYIKEHPYEPHYQVAAHFGFSSSHALWRFFQTHTGCNPDGTESKAPKIDNYSKMVRRIRGWKSHDN